MKQHVDEQLNMWVSMWMNMWVSMWIYNHVGQHVDEHNQTVAQYVEQNILPHKCFLPDTEHVRDCAMSSRVVFVFPIISTLRMSMCTCETKLAVLLSRSKGADIL